MQTTPYDERQVSEWLARLSIPAFAWAVLFALFAIAGLMVPPESTNTADATAALSPMGAIVAVPSAQDSRAPRAAEPEVKDAAVIAHEELDPIGVGRNGAP